MAPIVKPSLTNAVDTSEKVFPLQTYHTEIVGHIHQVAERLDDALISEHAI
jgi:hypothetical protein